MKTTLLALSAALTLMPALPAVAQPYDVPGADRREVRQDYQDVKQQARELNDARRYGSPADVAREQRDLAASKREFHRDDRDWRQARHYDYNRPDPRDGRYDAARYYRDGRYYQPRRLGPNDRIYRGYDGRYYCRRSDGTTGLIIGAVGGGILGNAISQGGSQTVGTLIGGALGAILGQSIDRGNVTCR